MNSSLDIGEEKDQRILSVRNYQDWIEKNQRLKRTGPRPTVG